MLRISEFARAGNYEQRVRLLDASAQLRELLKTK